MLLLPNSCTLYLFCFFVIDRFTEVFCMSMLVKRCMRATIHTHTHTCTHTVTLLLPFHQSPSVSLFLCSKHTRPREILWHGATHTHILWETEERSSHTHTHTHTHTNTETVAHVCAQECLAGWRGFLCSALGAWPRHISVCHDVFP